MTEKYFQTWIYGWNSLDNEQSEPCHFKKNNWQYLLPMIKFELSNEKQNFGKLHSPPWTWLKHLPYEIGGTTINR